MVYVAIHPFKHQFCRLCSVSVVFFSIYVDPLVNLLTSDIEVTEQSGSVDVCFMIGDFQTQIVSILFTLITEDITAAGIVYIPHIKCSWLSFI